MAVKPWRATSIQMRSERATQASDDEAARAVIRRNLDRLIGLIETACASNEKPDLVVFPEFALQGPPLSMTVTPWIQRACSTIPGPLTAPLQALARREEIYIAGNMFEAPPEWPGRYFNSSFLIGRDGEIVVNYRRVNTAAFPSVHDFMSDYLRATPQDQVFPIADTELGRLALIPCGEINVPEVARCYMMQGAEVILHPTNSKFTTGQEAAKVARATENMCYLISANVAGPIGFSPDNSILGGRSHILDHFGDTIAFEESAAEGVGVSGIIDIDRLRLDRRTDTGTHNPLLRARFEMYRPYYRQATFYPPDHFRDVPMMNAAETKAAVDISRANLERVRVLEPLSSR
ncbi:nitrilase-related carbon-nitrogen hydrolase [Rhizobium sp. 1399]|uniref:nitrilase-related carbon-nitrogen hydrolase n=1 Tax=Rhizobium sp. 1399 TaxID=2817758 RepID=UPI0028605DA8|nr:nitrilase-related carbon-nitrogen hydrolase [Rhizobium sp. 1399]MDR6666071.1 putative amidohydrolase [Rhizobium sp. 1399]